MPSRTQQVVDTLSVAVSIMLAVMVAVRLRSPPRVCWKVLQLRSRYSCDGIAVTGIVTVMLRLGLGLGVVPGLALIIGGGVGGSVPVDARLRDFANKKLFQKAPLRFPKEVQKRLLSKRVSKCL